MGLSFKKHTTKHKHKMFDLVPMGVFNGTLYQPSWFSNLNSFQDFGQKILQVQDKPGTKTFSLPTNLNPENLKLSLDRTSKTLSISANHEKNTNEQMLTSSFSYKFRLPENVKLESVKSHLDATTGQWAVSWDCQAENGENLRINMTE